MSSLPTNKKILLTLAKTLEKQKSNFPCSALFHMKIRKVPNILWMIVGDVMLLCPLGQSRKALTKIGEN